MTDDRWIRRFVQSPQATTRLVCLPHAGGSASYYLPLAKALAPKVEVLAIQYPGRQDRRTEPCLLSCQEMAAGASAALRPYLDKPITVFGHSMGASVAFELTRGLENAGVRPTALFASARRAPSLVKEGEAIHLLGDKDLIAEVQLLGGAGSHLLDDEDIQAMVLPSIRGDYQAAETYRWTPGPKLTTPIFGFVGDADPRVTVDDVRAWSEHTSSGFELKVFPGDHFYIDTNFDAVISTITTHIEAAQAVRP